MTKHEAVHLRDNRYAVSPVGQLGTCGFYPVPWTVIYVNARSEQEALIKAQRKAAKIPHLRKQFNTQRGLIND